MVFYNDVGILSVFKTIVNIIQELSISVVGGKIMQMQIIS